MYEDIRSLLMLSRNGDEKSKETLLLKLKPLIISSIRRYYNRIDQYDDLIQEGYEIILLCIDDYDRKREAHFLGYIKLKLKYHYLNKHKEKQYLSLNETINDSDIEIIDLIEGEEKDPIDIVTQREESKGLMESFSTLSLRQKEVLVEYYINNLSIGEIADKLKISYRTVVNTKTNGINKLKNAIVK